MPTSAYILQLKIKILLYTFFLARAQKVTGKHPKKSRVISKFTIPHFFEMFDLLN